MNLLALLLTLATYHEDVGSERLQAHRESIAQSVSRESKKAPRPPREWVALMLTVANHETHFSIRISDGNCRKHECDRGKAKGLYQLHRNSLNWDDWAKQDGNVPLQAKLGSDALRRAYYTCSRSGVPWLIGTLNAYAGKRCSANWPGLQARVATFNRLVGK